MNILEIAKKEGAKTQLRIDMVGDNHANLVIMTPDQLKAIVWHSLTMPPINLLNIGRAK